MIHGNEICGAIALDFLLSSGYTPTRGKLTVRPDRPRKTNAPFSGVDMCVCFLLKSDRLSRQAQDEHREEDHY